MIAVTLTIGIGFGILVLFLSRPAALGAYFLVLMCYPSFLVVDLAGLNISAGRMVVISLLIRYLTDCEVQILWKGRFNTVVGLFGIVSVMIPLLAYNMPVDRILANRSGMFLDSYLSFVVTIFSIRRLSDVVTFAKWVSFVVIYLAIIGVFETTTGRLPFLPLKAYCPWAVPGELTAAARHGFFRAEGPLSHPILFGMSFAMLLPLVFWLRHCGGWWRSFAWFAASACTVGAMSSMSSGPWMILIFVIVGLLLEKKKMLVRPIAMLALLGCAGIAVLSNRPFYHVLASYADPIGGTGWHRAKLIDNAIEYFSQWWLCGYGGLDPGWGPSLGMTWTDITNHYIVCAVQYGLLGLLLLVATLAVGVLDMRKVMVGKCGPAVQSLCWALATTLVALAIAFNSCTLFAQTNTLFFVLVGLVSSCGNFLAHTPQRVARVALGRTGQFPAHRPAHVRSSHV